MTGKLKSPAAANILSFPHFDVWKTYGEQMFAGERARIGRACSAGSERGARRGRAHQKKDKTPFMRDPAPML